MKLKVFTVFDIKAEAYLQPFFAQTVGQAIRSFTDAVRDQGHMFYKHAPDYTLFCVGEFDEASGDLIPCVPHSLGNAVEFLPSVPSLKEVSK